MRRRHPLHPPIDSPLAKEFLLPGDRRGVLLLHGFTASPAQFRPLGEALHREGYTVLCPLLPGHGTTIEEMEATGWRDWLRGARDGFMRLARTCDDISVAGLSMGGVLTLLLAEELPVKAAVSIAAPIRLRSRAAHLAFLAGAFVRYQGWSAAPDKPENEYHIGYPETPVRKVPDLLRLMRQAEQGLDKIKCPLLVVQPQKDDTVRLDSADRIVKGAVNAARKELIKLENSRHVCTVEPEFDALLAAVSRWLREA